VNFLIDAQLPPALASMLAAAGHRAVHVREVGLRDAIAQRRSHTATGPTIVWLRVGNVTTDALRIWLMPLLPQIEQMIAAGEGVIELR